MYFPHNELSPKGRMQRTLLLTEVWYVCAFCGEAHWARNYGRCVSCGRAGQLDDEPGPWNEVR